MKEKVNIMPGQQPQGTSSEISFSLYIILNVFDVAKRFFFFSHFITLPVHRRFSTQRLLKYRAYQSLNIIHNQYKFYISSFTINI